MVSNKKEQQFNPTFLLLFSWSHSMCLFSAYESIFSVIGLRLLGRRNFCEVQHFDISCSYIVNYMRSSRFFKSRKISTFRLWLCRHMADNIGMVIGVMKVMVLALVGCHTLVQ